MSKEDFYSEKKTSEMSPHYYGDIIRAIFVSAGVLMIVALPFYKNQIPVTPTEAILSIIVLGILAGFMSPRQKWVSIVDGVVSLVAVLVFEYYAVLAYKSVGQIFTGPFFLLNQVLAGLFFITLYLSVKTFRSTYFD